MTAKIIFSWFKCGYNVDHWAHGLFPSVPAPVRPWTSQPQAGPGHVDAGGQRPELSPPPAPAPLPSPHPPWLRAVTPAARGWTQTLTNRPAVSQTSWLPWRRKTWTAPLPTGWGMAGLSRTGLRPRGLIRCVLTWLEGSCRCRREALTCRQALEEATHTSPHVWLAGPRWSLNVCLYQTPRWGSNFYSYFIKTDNHLIVKMTITVWEMTDFPFPVRQKE